jgi:hypothetical protein
MRINFPNLDQISFWVGFIVSSILWLLIAFARPLFHQLIHNLRASRTAAKARTISLVEEHYLNNIYIKTQSMHLAASLFSLDDISIRPKLLAPPARITPDGVEYSGDFKSELIPYLPSWPEVAATFKAATLSFAEALSGKSDLVIIGQPGIGKSFSLAYLAARLAHRIEEPDSTNSKIPILIHIADINFQVNSQDPLASIVEYIKSFSPAGDLNRIPRFVNDSFRNGNVLLLLDGTDELSPEDLPTSINFIKMVKRNFPLTQVITTGISENLGDLVTLNFIPFTLASWDSQDYAIFINKWDQLWTQYVDAETWAQSGTGIIDHLLLNTWISSYNKSLTPIELTLLAWGTYAGDATGGKILDFTKAHIDRLKPADTPQEALEMLALQTLNAANSTFDPRKAREWIKSYEPSEVIPSIEYSNHKAHQEPDKKPNKLIRSGKSTPSLGLISKFVESGILVTHRNNNVSFIHPLFNGYLAGYVLGNLSPERIISMPNWSGKYLGMKYFAALGDPEKLATMLINIPDHPLERNILLVAKWLGDASLEAKWRVPVMEQLITLLRVPIQPMGLRGQVLAAILKSGDPGVPILLRQMLDADDPELLQLCALGIAFLKDSKSIDDLIGLLNHKSPNVHKAACLALVTIGTASALDPVASVLLHGDEDSRKAAAEALANHPEEGYGMLREGATLEDIMVRRAVAYGLGCIDQNWATEILSKLQLEDAHWIVRNAATEVLERKHHLNKRIPQRLLPPFECPWLIAFAGKQGIGISPNSSATDVLLLALSNGTEAEKLSALDYLRATPSSSVIGSLFNAMYGNNSVVRESAYRVIWELAARGVEIPDPKQFGVS